MSALYVVVASGIVHASFLAVVLHHLRAVADVGTSRRLRVQTPEDVPIVGELAAQIRGSTPYDSAESYVRACRMLGVRP